MKTAVEWLCENIYTIQRELSISNKSLIEKINQAKEMEKQQLELIYEGLLQNVGTCIKQSDLPTFEQYYNETFKTKL
jgi:hypothetical protein